VRHKDIQWWWLLQLNTNPDHNADNIIQQTTTPDEGLQLRMPESVRNHTWPMHCPTHGQWWSKQRTQLLQMEQWEQRGGRYSMQVSQYFVFTGTPFTITSLVRGSRKRGVCPPHSLGGVAESKSSGSGGWVLRGIIPGSLPDVNNKRTSTWWQEQHYQNQNLSRHIKAPKKWHQHLYQGEMMPEWILSNFTH